MKQVRLIDVAKEAGVSKSTASQYLNGRYEYMSEATKERLRQAVETLNFVPNPIARSLKTQKTNTIGVIVRSIMGHITSQTIRGIDDFLKEKGYNVLIYNTDFIKENEQKAIANLKSLRADGLIISSSGQISELLNDEYENGFPIVHTHLDFEALKVPNILSDYIKGSEDAVNYLTSLGHQRIALITRPYQDIASRNNRLIGYEKGLENAGIEVDPDLIRVMNDEDDIGPIYDQLMSLDPPPTAIFTLFSRLTIQLLDHCMEQKIQIPEDLSVICFDDLPMARFFSTPITTVNQEAYAIGQLAAETLWQQLNKNKEVSLPSTLPCDLLIRDSCKSVQ